MLIRQRDARPARRLDSLSFHEERRYNPRIAGKSREEFAAIMRELKLAPPKMLRVAVLANLGCGHGTSSG